MIRSVETSKDYIVHLIEALSHFNDTPGEGITRFSYSENDKKARELLFSIFRELGLSTHVDATGNITARYEGRDPALAPLLIGSHIDSVRHGGQFDGVTGVVCAIEVVRTLKNSHIVPQRPIEIIIFAEEEGSNFGTTMVGSKALVGKLAVEDLHTLHDEHADAFETMCRFGLRPDKIEESILRPKDVYGMLELHIEQGEVLDREGLKIGVVEAIAGMMSLRITMYGASNHAGATPMNMRQDPMVAAAQLIQEITHLAVSSPSSNTVATVGALSCEPNMPNVIARMVSFSVDIRDTLDEGIEFVLNGVRQALEKLRQEQGFEIECETVGHSDCIHLSQKMTDMIEREAKKLGVPYKRMPSGAVHDTALMSSITDAGMIFVPSRAGKSHCPEEFTEADDIKTGCDLLLQVVCDLACGA